MFKLVEVQIDLSYHLDYLYEILKRKKHNISHENMPDFEEHVQFVISNPYRYWYLVEKSSLLYGAVYITKDNVIGINLPSSKFQDYSEVLSILLGSHQPLPPINSVRSKYFTVNVHPNNLELIKALKFIKMEHIQNTYAYKIAI